MTGKVYKNRVARFLKSMRAKSEQLRDAYNLEVDEDLTAYETDYWNFVNAVLGLCADYEHIL